VRELGLALIGSEHGGAGVGDTQVQAHRVLGARLSAGGVEIEGEV